MKNKKNKKIFTKLLKNFIEALNYEIKAIKLAPQSQAFKITDGICKESISKTYFFRNPSSLEFRQDEQVTITINSVSYEGQIKDCNEASLFVAINSESSNKITKKIKIAYIKSDSSFLLISLRDILLNIENKLSENKDENKSIESIIPNFNINRAEKVIGQTDFKQINNEKEIEKKETENNKKVSFVNFLNQLSKKNKKRLQEAESEYQKTILMKEHLREYLSNNLSPEIESELNEEQKEFIDFSMKENVVYLWGPPGTGKSYTIASLAKLFFQDKKRILLVSNTNNAVDLLLKTFCESVSDSEGFKKGYIVKDGEIFNDDLEDKFGEYVNKEKIEQKIRKNYLYKLDPLLTKERELERILDDVKIDISEKENLYSQIKNKNKFKCYDELFFQELRSEEETIKKQISSKNSQINKIKKNQDQNFGEINNVKKSIEKAVQDWKSNISVTATTAYTSVLKYRDDGKNFYDVVIIDEVSMLPLPYVFFFSGLSKDKVILAGDFMQTEPILATKKKNREAYKFVREWYGKDIFRKAKIVDSLNKKQPYYNLKQFIMQYRMADKICSVVNNFYGNRLETSPDIKKDDKSIYFVDTNILSPTCERQSIHSYSKFNYIHAMAIVNYIQYLKRKHNEKIENKSYLGVITPYNAQVKLIERLLIDRGIDTVKVGTINKFQGDERDIIIFDTMESPAGFNQKNSVFVEPFSDNKFNVAISRAKSKIIIFANHPWFKKQVILATDILGSRKLSPRVQRAYDDMYELSIKKDVNDFFLTTENSDPAMHPASVTQDDSAIRICYEKEIDVLRKRLEKTEKDQKKIEKNKKNQKKQKQKEIVDIEINYINLERQNKTLKKQMEFLLDDYENIKNRELDWEYLLDKENIIPRLRKDIELAKESILIYASFYTENMINYWKPILEKKIKEGVKVKCFARKPSRKSTEKFINIKKLIDIGVIVDFEEGQHIKDVHIDFKILYTGSANILSFNGKSIENFRRIINTSNIKQKLMLPYSSRKNPEMLLMKQYRPCSKCKSHTYLSQKKQLICIEPKCK
jgi:superfamily I DNA and/or RNA helicase